MTTNYFANLEIPLELQLKLTELVTAPAVSVESGVWTPEVTHQGGGVPDIISAAEQSYTVVDGLVTTSFTASCISFAGCAEFGIQLTNFPFWNRDNITKLVGYTVLGSAGATLSPLSLTFTGSSGSKIAVFNLPSLGAGGISAVQLVAMYSKTIL